MSLRIKDKVKKIRRSLSWHTTSNEVNGNLDGRRGSVSHSSNNSYNLIGGLPPGWESAIDKDGRLYYINHIENISTYNDPRNQRDVEYEYAETRIIALTRDTQLGFGFVAGSERPVVVRCVTEGGPSDQLLLPGDQIHKIDSEDVRDAPRSRVIELVRSAAQELVLTVSQPPTISTHGKKSILLNAAKKQQRLKRDSSATRVRFSDDSVSKKKRISLPIQGGLEANLSNVLKVHVEANQTRSFKYDGFTLVKDVLNALQSKLDIRCVEHFGLVLHNLKSPLSAKMTILSPQEKVKQVVEQLTEDTIRCMFRIVYVPRDAYELLRKDSIAFQYFYTQCCQDVINERFSSDLKCDVALRLASLHMQQVAIDKQIPFQKISIKLIEREFGLGMFLNPSMLRAVRPKELRKMLGHFMKLNQGLIAPGQRQVTPLQAKLHYMKIVSELRSFGGKCFLATLVDRRAEVMLLVGPKCGISQVTDIKSFTLHMLADFDLIEVINVQAEASGATQLISVLLSDKNLPTLGLSMMNTDAKDFLIFVQGYHKLFCGTADLIKYDQKIAATVQPTSRDPHTPPTLHKPLSFDHNKNDMREPDYATIEDVLSDGTSTLDWEATGSLNVKPQNITGSVSVANVIPPRPATPAQSPDHLNTHTEATNGHEPYYDITPDETDSAPPPTSSIDDLILNSSPEDSLSSPRGSVCASAVDGLTDECISELSRLDDAGILLDPRLFKDKGLYVDPQPSNIDLVVLPPPLDEHTAPISPPSIIHPPPTLFNDDLDTAATEAQQQHADREIGVQLGAVDALNLGDIGDKESGIDSDDSGTETFNSTDNTPNLSHNSTFNITSSPDAKRQSRDGSSISPTQLPASSLRSRLQEQRARAKQLAESSPAEQTAVFPFPVKPVGSSWPSDSQRGGQQVDTEPTTVLNGEKQDDIDARMVDALMQFTHELSTDTEPSDVSDNEAGEEVNGRGKPPSAMPLMMLNEGHVEVSTEEEDNDDMTGLGTAAVDPNADLAEPLYMNSEIDIPVIPKVQSKEQIVAAAAIDEALNGLSSESESEELPVTSSTFVSNAKVSKENGHGHTMKSVSSKDTTLTRKQESAKPQTKKVSATIVITDDSLDFIAVYKTDEPSPKAPPRRRKGMKSSSSMASLSTLGERPPSRASVTTIGSVETSEGSPRPGILRRTSIDSNRDANVQNPGYNRSTSVSSVLSGQSADRLSLGGASITSSEQPSPRFLRQNSENPISNDLFMLRTKTNRKAKSDRRASRTASVIGMPTNISCTAGDILANCIPIVKADASPRSQPVSSQQLSPASVKLTSRESLLDEIVRNAQGMGIDTLGLTSRDEVEAGVKRRNADKRKSVGRDSLRSTDSKDSTHIRAVTRPTAPPPQPPSLNSARSSALKASRSEGDLLAARTLSHVSDSNEAMFEIEYAVLDNKSALDHTGVGISRRLSTASTVAKPSSSPVMAAGKSSQSVAAKRETSSAAADSRPPETSTSSGAAKNLSRAESSLNRTSGLEKDGSFIKFSGYSGEPSLSPSLYRKGRFRKKGSSASMVGDHAVEGSQGKRGIMAKILSTIKPKRRSMSLERLTVETNRKLESGSLKLSSEGSNNRPSILPLGEGKHSKSQHVFRSFGRSRFHSKPKLSVSLTDLVFDSQPESNGVVSPTIGSRSHSVDCLADAQISSPIPTEVEEEEEEAVELLTSAAKINPQGILHYTYVPHNAFEEAISHTDNLIEHFTTYCDTQWAPALRPDPHNFTKIKETLIAEGRQFVSNSKQLVVGVSQATSPTDAVLISKMAASVRTLAKIIQEGIEALKVTASEYNMASLKECVVTVSEAYADVLQTSHKAAGKSIQDVNMMVIMQKASHLASLLSLFFKTLRSLHETA